MPSAVETRPVLAQAGGGLVAEGRVRVAGKVVRNGSMRVDPGRDRIEVDGSRVVAERKVYLMINKPRGLVTTRDDPQDRGTVYDCLAGVALPFVSPVGRLDKASEGLLLMTNDTRFAQRLLDPASHVAKIYHVQIGARPTRPCWRGCAPARRSTARI